MASLTASGVGSGLDINSLLEQIVAAERTPTENRLNLKEVQIQAKLSAYGTLKGAVNTFQSSLSKLKTSTGFLSNSVNVSNKDVLSATASSIAEAGSYSVEVNQLAQAHVLASVKFNDLDSVIGNGELTFRFGTTVYDPGTSFATGDDTYTSFTQNTEHPGKTITIDNSNNTVQGLRDAINAANMGVSASVVNDGSGYRLLISSKQQGLKNSMEISVDEGGAPANNTDTAGLSQLAFNSSATNMEQTQAGQNAGILVNGLLVTRESNTIGDAIKGVTINLLEAKPGTPVQIKISQDSASVEKNISSFVTAYNEMLGIYKNYTDWDAETSRGGILTGDVTARNLMMQIRREVGAVLGNGSRYNSLSSIGITTSRDGTLILDSNTLHNAITDDISAVGSLFYTMANTTDSGISYQTSTSATQEGNYSVRIATAATQGSLTGVAVNVPVVIGAGNDSFSVVVNGVPSGTLTLTHATYNDMDELAKEIQNRINASSPLLRRGYGVTVVYNTDHFQIESLRYGNASTVELSTANSSIGFSGASVSTAGQDVSGSIGDTGASGSGQILTGRGDASGLALKIEGNSIGNRGYVSFNRGLGGTLDSILNQFLSEKGQLTARTNSLNSQIEDIGTQREKLAQRLVAIEDRYRAQFTAMDALVAQLQSTGNYLQQQLNSLPEVKVK